MGLKMIPPPRAVLKTLFGLLFFLLFQNSCLGGQWTMMFYLAADNDLYSQALIDIKELQRISGQPGVEILVQLDSPSGTYRYRIQPQGISILASLDQRNSGSPQALSDFGGWAVKMCPASQYLLVLWDHGDGWSKAGKSIGIDGLDYLSVAQGELRQALSSISAAAGQPLDLVVFDACSMQMAEVLMELEGLCRYSVGSQALFPAEGMPYDAAWGNINGNTPAESLAVSLVRSCGGFDAGYQVTCSAVDIEALARSARTLKNLVSQFRVLPSSDLPVLASITDSVLSFPPYVSYDLAEMLGFIGSRVPATVGARLEESGRLVKESVLAQSVTGSQYQKANGVAVWQPGGTHNFESGIDLYRRMQWSGSSGWDRILHHLAYQSDKVSAVPQNMKLEEGASESRRLCWEPGYEPSGIEKFQVRRSQNLVTSFSDQGGAGDSANWTKTGFTIVLESDGDTAYYSIGGQMTLRVKIPMDSSGNLGFWADGWWGSVIVESGSDTAGTWDTLGSWNYYGNAGKRYCSACIGNDQAYLRFSWRPFSAGYRVFIDDIRICFPEAGKKTEIFETIHPYYDLSVLSGGEGFYQVRTTDSLGNTGPWSQSIYVAATENRIKAWPNPFTKKIFLRFSTPAPANGEVKIYNILGQYIDRMSLQQQAIIGSQTEYMYRWEPKAYLAEGVYFAKVISGRNTGTVRLILIR